MGTPRYPSEFSKMRRDQENQSADAFTVATKSGLRPYPSGVVSDYDSSRWPATTSASYEALQLVSHVHSHPIYEIWVRANAPAGGARIRVTDSSGTVVLFETSALTSGTQNIFASLELPSVYSSYDSFYLRMEAKSTVAGQTTRAVIAGFNGSE